MNKNFESKYGTVNSYDALQSMRYMLVPMFIAVRRCVYSEFSTRVNFERIHRFFIYHDDSSVFSAVQMPLFRLFTTIYSLKLIVLINIAKK